MNSTEQNLPQTLDQFNYLILTRRILKNSRRDPLKIESNRIRVSTSSTISNDPAVNTDFNIGSTILQERRGIGTASGIVVGYGGSITTLAVTGGGVGYINGTAHNNVSLTTKSGRGVNATANITVSGNITGATIANGNGGSGFNKGDVLLVPSLELIQLE